MMLERTHGCMFLWHRHVSHTSLALNVCCVFVYCVLEYGAGLRIVTAM